MEGSGGPWSYRRKAIGSNSAYTIASSSTSGTVSTAYTSSGSHLCSDPAFGQRPSGFTQSSINMDLNLMFGEASSCEATMNQRMAEQKKEHIKGLVQEFFGDQSRNCNTNSGNVSILDRWFTELGAGCIFHSVDVASAGELHHSSAVQSWMWALYKIMETIRFTRVLFPGGAAMGVHGICEEEEPAETETETQASLPDMSQFERFAQESMIKMLSFVDVIIALNTDTARGISVNSNGLTYDKLSTLLYVHGALSKVSSEISRNLSNQVERKEDEIVCLLSDKEAKVREAIWSKIEETRNHILESMEGDDKSWLGNQTQRRLSIIHKVTESVTYYIRFLHANYLQVDRIVSEGGTLGKHETQNGETFTLLSLTKEMISFLEEKIVKTSLAFQDQSFRFLYLVNNSYFIRERLHMLPLLVSESCMQHLHCKIEYYIQSFLQVSWTSLLSCLSYTRSFCLFRLSPLPKFESEFWKTYNAQRLWKVRNPVLRTRLRRAIVKTVAPRYREYLEENNNVTPRITTEEMERMLQQLFEG